jgi:hypothetical protein
MGWRRFGDRDQGITGDQPLDAAATAAERIASAYEERVGRLPMLAEVLHALRIALAGRPDELLFDPESLDRHPPTAPFPADAPLDLDRYAAAWSDRPAPAGAYYVAERATDRDVLRCAVRVEHRVLVVDYELLQPGLDADDAKRLILHNLIRHLLRDRHAGEVDEVSIAAVSSPEARTVHRFPDAG